LFWNQKLGKKLSRGDAKEVLEFMRSQGRVEWIGKGEAEAWIWWRDVEEWAGVLYDWVSGFTILEKPRRNRQREARKVGIYAD
jgi:hypothetical protein